MSFSTSSLVTSLHLAIIGLGVGLYGACVRATVRLCRIKEKCLKTDLKYDNGWSSSTVQWKRVPKSRSINRETTSTAAVSKFCGGTDRNLVCG